MPKYKTLGSPRIHWVLQQVLELTFLTNFEEKEGKKGKYFEAQVKDEMDTDGPIMLLTGHTVLKANLEEHYGADKVIGQTVRITYNGMVKNYHSYTVQVPDEGK